MYKAPRYKTLAMLSDYCITTEVECVYCPADSEASLEGRHPGEPHFSQKSAT